MASGEISTWSTDSNISEVVFAGPTSTSILYINATNEEGDGGISLYTADAADLASAVLVASLPAPFSGLEAVSTPSGDIHFLVNAKAYTNGTSPTYLSLPTSHFYWQLERILYHEVGQ